MRFWGYNWALEMSLSYIKLNIVDSRSDVYFVFVFFNFNFVLTIISVSECYAVIQDDWTWRKVMGPLPLRAAQVHSKA